jgi:aspartokinase/homoserine dehydrogenase 1
MESQGDRGRAGDAAAPRRWRVLKFGGSSISTAAGVEVMARAIQAARDDGVMPVVVVSAFAGVTDALHALAREAAIGVGDPGPSLDRLRELHHARLMELVRPAGDGTGDLPDQVEAALAEAERLLRGMSLLRERPPRTLDALLATGEMLSARVAAAALERRGVAATAQDPREWIRTDDRFGNATVDLGESAERMARTAAAVNGVPVVPGFVGAGPSGEITTLGRGASDLSAAVLGACLPGVDRVEIWTDVDGVHSADPRVVPDARLLERMSYQELWELTHGGAKVVHPRATRVLAERGVPMAVRNTFAPDGPGTRVSPDAGSGGDAPVRGVASDVDVAVLQITTGSSDAMPGLTSRALAALERGGVRVLLVTRGAGSPSLCVAVPGGDAGGATRILEEELRLERGAGLVAGVKVEQECAVVTVVGDGMRSRAGISGRVFGVLGRHGVNVRAIAQGASENTISVVVSGEDGPAAIRAVHDAFFAPRPRPGRVYVAGVGRVGGALLEQLARRGREERIILAGVAGSRQVALSLPDGPPEGLDPRSWSEHAVDGDGRALVEAVVASPHHPRIFVDCTASEEVASWYPRLLEAGVAVVTANKVAPAGPGERVRALLDARREGADIYYETTVGAGLPVLRTVQGLVATGDRIHRVEGVLSGTLGYLCDGVMAGRPFSETLREAYDRGFTEPDPRDDLSGRDVARKVLILGRCAGFELDGEDVEVTPLLEVGGRDLPLDAFWDAISAQDPMWEELRVKALDQGGRLAYMGRVNARGGQVGLEVVSGDHPCGRAQGTENVITVTSDRYGALPLVVTGPGAGPDVTAAGVFADILRARSEAAELPVILGREPGS